MLLRELVPERLGRHTSIDGPYSLKQTPEQFSQHENHGSLSFRLRERSPRDAEAELRVPVTDGSRFGRPVWPPLPQHSRVFLPGLLGDVWRGGNVLQILGVVHLWRAPAVPAAPLLEVDHDGVQPVRPLVHDDVVQLHVGVKAGWGLADVQQRSRHLARPAELLFQSQTAAAAARSRRERLLQRASCVVSEHEAADADLAAEPAPLRDDVEGPRDDVRVRRHAEQQLELVVQELAVGGRGLEHEGLVAAVVARHRHQRDRVVQLALQLHAAEIALLRPPPRSAVDVGAPHALQRVGAEPLLLDVIVRDEVHGDGLGVGADPVNHDARAERHAVVELRELCGGVAVRPALEDAEDELGDRQVCELAAAVDEHGGVGLQDPADFWRVLRGSGDVHVDAEGTPVEGERGGNEEAGAVHLAAVEAPGRREDRGQAVYSVLGVQRGAFPGSWAAGWRGLRRERRREGGGWVHDRVEHIWRGLHIGI